MKKTTLKAIFALAAVIALLSNCGGPKTTGAGGGESGTTAVTTRAAARAAAATPTAPAEEPDTAWYNEQDEEFWLSKAGQLAGLAQLVNRGNRFAGKTIKLTANLDISGYTKGAAFNEGKGWIPIGIGFNMFKGAFDGGGKVIRGLSIHDATLFSAGLFGRIEGGSVKNLGLTDVNITSGGRTGAVTAILGNGSVEQCYSTGNIKGKAFVGGLVGHVDKKSRVARSYSSATVTGENYVGGVVGDADGGSTVTLTYYSGEEVKGNEAVGGVAGGAIGRGSSVTNSYSTGKIACGSNCGGVIGKVLDGATVTNTYATGEVSGRTRVGGIAGQVQGAVTGSVAINLSVKAEGKGYAGRVTGQSDGKGGSSGNLAFTGIRNSAGNTDWPANRDDKNKYGADINAAQISNDGTIGGRFTEEKGWTTMRGMLPGFGGGVRVPEHMR